MEWVTLGIAIWGSVTGTVGCIIGIQSARRASLKWRREQVKWDGEIAPGEKGAWVIKVTHDGHETADFAEVLPDGLDRWAIHRFPAIRVRRGESMEVTIRPPADYATPRLPGSVQVRWLDGRKRRTEQVRLHASRPELDSRSPEGDDD